MTPQGIQQNLGVKPECSGTGRKIFDFSDVCPPYRQFAHLSIASSIRTVPPSETLDRRTRNSLLTTWRVPRRVLARLFLLEWTRMRAADPECESLSAAELRYRLQLRSAPYNRVWAR